MPYCANCGAELEGIESFCPYCGEIIKNISKVSKPSIDPQVEALKKEVSSLKQQLQNQNRPVIYQQQKQDSNCLICCCITIVIMVILVILPRIFFW